MSENFWVGYKNYNHEFIFEHYQKFISEVKESLVNQQYLVESNKITYYNIPASFDIETYSSYYKGRKFANMYIWQLGINGSTIYGRTWKQFQTIMRWLTSDLELSLSKRLILYVHNLGYEFQFMRKWLKWARDKDGQEVIFSLKERRPIYALTDFGVEFRCSFILSNYALGYIGANLLLKYPVEKKVGDLDYTIPRNSQTELTPAELGYCLNDVRVVMSYIQEQIEQYSDISKIPLTNTGRVRRFVREYVNGSYESDPVERKKIAASYYTLMSFLQITTRAEYDLLKLAFVGGFSHGNSIYIGEVLQNLGAWDLSSSYPAVMCSRYFPMSSAKYVGQPSEDDFNYYLEHKCCLFKLTLIRPTCSFDFEGYISESRCIEIEGSDDYPIVVNNGRVMSCERLTVAITELDFDIISKVYQADDFSYSSMYIYDRGYLPRDLILAILHLYGNKTSLKGIEEKIIEYMVSKNMINATYGMIVTDIVRSEIIYTDRWSTIEPNAMDQLNDYNSSFNRFLFYPWGVWVTAHARHNLWEAIFEFGEDYVYSDTDSIKGLNREKHLKFFEDYNNRQIHELCKMCMYYKIPLSKVQPKTKKGVVKPLGVWDEEEGYRYFKTLGSKRYCYEHYSGEFNMTVAGVNKSGVIPFLLSKFCDFDFDLLQLAYTNDPNKQEESHKALQTVIQQHNDGKSYQGAFDNFKFNLEIPQGHSGKNTHTYCDKESIAYIIDTQGHRELCYEKSFIHLEPASYYFSVSKQFFDFLLFDRVTIGL